MMRRRAAMTMLLLVCAGGRLVAQAPPADAPLKWLGIASEQAIPYASSERGELCVEIGPPRVFGDETWVALRGFAWPGLPTDSQIFLPVDGPLRVGVVRTPGPTPRIEMLVPPFPEAAPGLPGGGETVDAGLAAGWFTIDVGGSARRVHLGCEGCGPGLTIVTFAAGEGLASVEVAGHEPAERIRRLPGTCEPARIRLELQVSPAS